MRIDQPRYIRERLAVTFREETRLGVVPYSIFMGLVSGISLLGLWGNRNLRIQPIAPWRWLMAAAWGPLMVAFVLAVVRLAALTPKSMQLRDGVLHLRGFGYRVRPEKLDAFVINPDAVNPALAWCGIRFRYALFLRTRIWGMFVDDVPAAEAFRREVLKGIPEPRRSIVESGESP